MSFLVSKLPKKLGPPLQQNILYNTKNSKLDFFQQIWLLLRRVFRFIRKDRRVQLLICAFLLVYAYIAYRVLRFLKVRLQAVVEMNASNVLSRPMGRCFFDFE